MKPIILIIFLLGGMNPSDIAVDVALHNYPYSIVTNSDIANIAIQAAGDIKEYYTWNFAGNCQFSKNVDVDNEVVDVIKNRKLKGIKVMLFEERGMAMVFSFNDAETEIAVQVYLKNRRCNEFFLYKSKVWSDPV